MNLGMIQKFIDNKKLANKGTLDHAALKEAGLARGGKDGVRLLAKGEIKAKINIAVAGASKSAVEAVEKAGGKVEILNNAVEHRAKGEKKKTPSKPAKREKGS